MKRFVISVLGALLMSATAATAQCVLTEDGSGIQCQTLFAGQTIDAGTVCVEVVGDDLLVTYTTTGGWELVETHTWIGDNLADMPQTRKGNPKIGNFPYHSGDITGDTSYSFTIPLSDMGYGCPGDDQIYYLAAHAALRKPDGNGGYQTETGWGDGDTFVDRGAWGTFSAFTLTCECDGGGGEPSDCETAFAFGGDLATCFLDIDEDGDGTRDFNRWGWTNKITTDGVYVFDIYAGAGQCDLTKGTLVGTLTVTVSFESDANGEWADVHVQYDVIAPYSMDEVHLYVGDEILATNDGQFTVAPGQYPCIGDAEDATGWDSAVAWGAISVHPDEFGNYNINVVAHAVVCGF